MHTLSSLVPGMPVLFGGDRVTYVSERLAQQYKEGDRLLILQESGELLHIPRREYELAGQGVTKALTAFSELSATSDNQIRAFFNIFAAHLKDEKIWQEIKHVNLSDVTAAKEKGRSTTRLLVDEKMRSAMISGLCEWRDAEGSCGRVLETVKHQGWQVDQVTAPLGVLGFVFEGRPNVLADAAGVVRNRNAIVFRIGSDALRTAQAIMAFAVRPALETAGLPREAVVLLESVERASAWALFSDRRLSLAVARGSGAAVSQLGEIAKQAGVPVSLHGRGGAWIIADETADLLRLETVVHSSLDRKVCNSLNVCCLPAKRADELVAAFLRGLDRAGRERGYGYKLHVIKGSESFVNPVLFQTKTKVKRAGGTFEEDLADILPEERLGDEWEWEETPEVTLMVVNRIDEAIEAFNRYSPQFIASLISETPEVHQAFWDQVQAPFIGDGFTRWVDGQYALRRPELGLSNWEGGRLFARSGILSGDGIITIRTRASQEDMTLRR